MSKVTTAYINVRERLYRKARETDGQTMAEYALIVALVAVVAVGAWGLLGGNITNTVNGIAGDI